MRRMLRSITPQQFFDWEAYSQIERFGERRQDYRNAQIIQTLWNINRDTKLRPEPYQLEECLLEPKLPQAPQRKMTWQEQKQAAKLWAAAMARSKKPLKPQKQRAAIVRRPRRAKP